MNGGLSEVMLLGFVLFVCWTQKKFNTEWLGNKGLRKEYSTNLLNVLNFVEFDQKKYYINKNGF